MYVYFTVAAVYAFVNCMYNVRYMRYTLLRNICILYGSCVLCCCEIYVYFTVPEDICFCDMYFYCTEDAVVAVVKCIYTVW